MHETTVYRLLATLKDSGCWSGHTGARPAVFALAAEAITTTNWCAGTAGR